MTIVPPEVADGKDEDRETTERTKTAFQTVGDAEPAVQKYKDSRSLNVFNKTGEHGISFS